MELFPAIDLYGGKAVRLLRGDYAEMTVYDSDPPATAARFSAAGCGYLHVVDLEGAKDGTCPNLGTVRDIIRRTGARVQVGGGVRSEAAVTSYLEAGACRVILGTAAVTDPGFLSEMVSKYGERIAVGIDLRDGMAAIRGWTEQSALTAAALFDRVCAAGVGTVICTDISRDGVMAGANIALYADLAARYPVNIIASGGVTTLGDLTALAEHGLYGAILGKALYTGAIDLREAVALCRAGGAG